MITRYEQTNEEKESRNLWETIERKREEILLTNEVNKAEA
jgi:hypothetical protein